MEKHKHIPFKHGHITWTGDGHPSEEMMQVFNEMGKMAIEKAEKENTREHKITVLFRQKFIIDND